MIKTYIKLILILLLESISENVLPQNIPNDDLLKQLNNKYEKIKDYSVDATIKVDLPFIKMFPNNAKIYFKSKNKFKVVSKAINVVPKSGFSQITTILDNYLKYDYLNKGQEIINGIETTVINLIAPSDTSDLILCKLWIEPKLLLIYKLQLTTKSNGTVLIEYKYGSAKEFSLPDSITFSIDMKKFNLPKVLGADINRSTNENHAVTRKAEKGTIHITLNNYKINKGISDLIFE